MARAITIEAENLSKRYSLTLPTSVARWIFKLAGREHHRLNREVWALRDVSFAVPRGACLGVVGANGAGKSTLLKILCGVTRPTAGRVRAEGRVAPLIEVGAGFHPELSARQNVLLNGVILGMSRREVRRKLETIVDFAELRDFIDVPVKKYSSGMFMRLAFSVAVHSDPDILLVDEVLSVGDLSFQERSMDRIRAIRRSGETTVVIVSHALTQVSILADEVLWLDEGREAYRGDPSEAIIRYTRAQSERPAPDSWHKPQAVVEICGARLNGMEAPEKKPSLGFPASLRVDLSYVASRRIEQPYFSLAVKGRGGYLFLASMILDGQRPPFIEGPGEIAVEFDDVRLLPGTYQVVIQVNSEDNLEILSGGEVFVGAFTIDSPASEYGFEGALAPHVSQYSAAVVVPYRWIHPGGVDRPGVGDRGR